MAGWSKVANDSVFDCLETLEKLQMNGFMFGLKPGSGFHVDEDEGKIRCLFNRFLSAFLKNVCPSHFLRRLPPTDADGKSVDLLKLYLVVREKEGYESVSRNCLWDSVANEAEIGSGSITKLIYNKYLDTLDTWLQKVHSKGDLVSQLRLFISEFSNQKKEDSANLRTVREDESYRKRKRECNSGMVDWVKRVAKDPCDLAVETVPEVYKWKSYGTDKLWKQVLLAREKMLVKRTDLGVEQSKWQKQRMHPFMYEDQNGSERSRLSKWIRSAKELLYMKSTPQRPAREDNKRILVGRHFQAEISEWANGGNYETDLKWLGTRIWPPEDQEHVTCPIKNTNPVGKGRSILCDCDLPGTIQCIRFHIAEERMRVKIELGSAFEHWRFDKMGEEVALSWTKEEGKKFWDTVSPNEYFWEDLYETFPGKKRGELVIYYFNVFLIKRRRYQNRCTPSNIDSDDDVPEIGSDTNDGDLARGI